VTIASSPGTSTTGLVRGLVRLARPRQWLKNLLVFAAPAAAGVLTHGDVLARTLVAFVALCCGASGLYYINDARDVDEDRRHPRKRLRPVASGVVPVRVAFAGGGVLIALGLGISAALGLTSFLVLASYLVLSVSYTFLLKNEPVLDVLLVAGGFLLRAVLGGVATDVRPSTWFLLVTMFGSLFVIGGKRLAEFIELGDDRALHRAALARYSEAFLRQFVTTACTAMLVAYCLWAFEQGASSAHPIVHQLTIAPVLVVVFRYLLLVSAGGGAEPERALLSDWVTVGAGVVWVALTIAAVYA
jgi:decaprenyl-phosphate phosphoribosyltransferase